MVPGHGGTAYGQASLASGGDGATNAGAGGFGGGGGGGGGGYAYYADSYHYAGLGGGGGGGGWGGGTGGTGGRLRTGTIQSYRASGLGGGGGGSYLRDSAITHAYAMGGGSAEFPGDGRVLISFLDPLGAAIPEPGTLGLFGLSLAGLGLLRRRGR
jgi:hypothetical protein